MPGLLKLSAVSAGHISVRCIQASIFVHQNMSPEHIQISGLPVTGSALVFKTGGRAKLRSKTVVVFLRPCCLHCHWVLTDSWFCSFGTVLWEICTGEIPQKPLRHVNDKAHPREAPKEVGHLIEKCLSTEPSHRPTMQEAYLALKDL